MSDTTQETNSAESQTLDSEAENFSAEHDQHQSTVNEGVKQPLDYAAQFELETGYKDIHSLNEANQKVQQDLQNRVDEYKNKFEQAHINSSILAESSQAISTSLVHEILANKAQCDEKGNVSIDGVTVAESVRNLLNKYPFLAKAQGGPGSGAPQSSGGANKMSRSAYKQLSNHDQSKFINSGGKVTD